MAIPIIFPIPKVMAAAINPKMIWRKPENHRFLPVNNVMAPPIINNPSVLSAMLRMIAWIPVVKINGSTGIIPPMVNIMNE